MNNWISVKDKLPRYNETVLVYRPTMAEKILADHYYGFMVKTMMNGMKVGHGMEKTQTAKTL